MGCILERWPCVTQMTLCDPDDPVWPIFKVIHNNLTENCLLLQDLFSETSLGWFLLAFILMAKESTVALVTVHQHYLTHGTRGRETASMANCGARHSQSTWIYPMSNATLAQLPNGVVRLVMLWNSRYFGSFKNLEEGHFQLFCYDLYSWPCMWNSDPPCNEGGHDGMIHPVMKLGGGHHGVSCLCSLPEILWS